MVVFQFKIYNKDFINRQNVFIKDGEDDRVVNYYFFNEDELKPGDTVELLCDYGHTYESKFFSCSID